MNHSINIYFDRLNEPIITKYKDKYYLAVMINKELILIAEFIEPIKLGNQENEYEQMQSTKQ